MNDLLDKLVSAIADEVRKKLPEHKEVSAEELRDSISTMLQEAAWFRQLVQEAASEQISVDVIVEEVKDRFHNDFNIKNYDTEIAEIAERVLDDYDFSEAVRSVLDDYDFSDIMESALNDADVENMASKAAEAVAEDAVAPLNESIEEIKQRVEKFDAFLKAIVKAVMQYTAGGSEEEQDRRENK